MNSKRNLALWFVLGTLGILLIRFWALGEKPVHHDESINGWFVMQMWSLGYFKYDPSNYHGPLLFYLFQWLEPFFGSSLYMMRGLTTTASALTVAILFAIGLFQKRIAFSVAALVLLLSPAGEFFGRSAIHESLFALSQLLVLWGLGHRWRVAWLGFCGMLLLKETWALFVVALLMGFVWSRFWQTEEWQRISAIVKKNYHIVVKSMLWGIAAVFFIYTGFLQNPWGAVDFFKAFIPWAKTGTGPSGHEKPVFYWLELMAKNEPLTMLFTGLSLYGLFSKSRRTQFFSATAIFHLLIYSLIPYKTPWCLLSFQITILWSGALVLEEMLQTTLSAWKRATPGVLMAASLVQISTLARICWISPIDLNHAYVYVQGEYDLKNLMTAITRNKNRLFSEKLTIATAENWPFPWLLREYPQLKFALPDSAPDVQDAVILFDEVQKKRVDLVLQKSHFSKVIRIRQARESAVVYIRNDIMQTMGEF